MTVTEHFTRNTLEATAWCKRCNRNTLHRIDDGRVGPCLDPGHPTPLPRAVIPPWDPPADDSKQGELFKSTKGEKQ
jgi:hypothetical protein